MFEIKGKVNTAVCYAKTAEDEAIEQIRRMCDYDFTQNNKIRIMPDVHAGKGCTIGTTMTVTDKVVPNIVGVDIGCGMYTVCLGKGDINFAELDEAAALGKLDKICGDFDGAQFITRPSVLSYGHVSLSFCSSSICAAISALARA